MPSKMVTDREKSVNAVLANEIHLDGAAAKLAEELRPYLREGEVMPDLALPVRLMLRRMVAKKDALVAADDAHLAELADDVPAREERDEDAEAGRKVVSDLRTLVTAVFSAEVAALLGLPSVLPNDPQVIRRVLAQVAARLPDTELGEPLQAGITLDVAFWTRRLEDAEQRIAASLDAITRESREAQQTLIAKERAMDDSDACFNDAARSTSTLFSAAREPDLARETRPSFQRPGRRVVDVGGDEREE